MSEVANKWGNLVAERGFSQVPNYLLLLNQFIDPENRLSPLELLILIELSGSWWKKEEQPFPSMRTLSIRCGTSERQVLRAVSRLEELTLIKRVKRRSQGLIASNAYDLTPLVDMLTQVAKQYPNEFPRKTKAPDAKAPDAKAPDAKPRRRLPQHRKAKEVGGE
jgi:DNA-binding transcriptional MocR family regulator